MSPAPEFITPLIVAVVAGGAIGLEREWRGRAAGFRTHILVCLASAVLMRLAVSQDQWGFSGVVGANVTADPTRLAHGVLTGIGFLCAGVIFRSGFSIHGLTTAASLWITAALGLTFGAGLYALGGTAVALTLAVLVGLRLISRKLPAQRLVDVEIAWSPKEDGALEAIETELAALDPAMRRTAHALGEDGARRQAYRLRVSDVRLHHLAERLAGTAGVRAFSIDPRDD